MKQMKQLISSLSPPGRIRTSTALAGLIWFLALGALQADEGTIAEAVQEGSKPVAGSVEVPPRPKREVPQRIAAHLEQQAKANSTTSEHTTKDETIAHARALSRAFRDSAQIALPSVVTVFCQSKRSNAANNPILNIIGGEKEQLFDSVGSGVIIQSDGLILTNHHVVADAARIEVRLQDGRQFEAEAPKSDRQSDVAILKINVSEELPAAKIGSSSRAFRG